MVFGVNKKLLKQIWPLLILLAIAVFAPAIAPWDSMGNDRALPQTVRPASTGDQ